MLNRQKIEQYAEVGAIVVPGLIDRAVIARMNGVLAGLVERSREVAAHDDVDDLEPGHSREAPRVRRIKKPHEVDAVFAECVRSEAILAPVRLVMPGSHTGPTCDHHGADGHFCGAMDADASGKIIAAT